MIRKNRRQSKSATYLCRPIGSPMKDLNAISCMKSYNSQSSPGGVHPSGLSILFGANIAVILCNVRIMIVQTLPSVLSDRDYLHQFYEIADIDPTVKIYILNGGRIGFRCDILHKTHEV